MTAARGTASPGRRAAAIPTCGSCRSDGRRRHPPLNPPPPYPVLVVVIYAAALIFLVLARYGLVFRRPDRLDRLWMCWPVCMAVYFLSSYSLNTEGVSKMGAGRDLSDPMSSLIFSLPIAGFGLLLVSEMITWLFAALAKQRTFASLRHPVMSVHLTTWMYYISEPGLESCTMSDAFGRPLHPMRYVMWTISVAAMCYALYLVVESVLQQPGVSRAPSHTPSWSSVMVPTHEAPDALAPSYTRMRRMLLGAWLGCYGTSP